ncbi:MAG: pepsin-like aspartic protease [Acidobacteriota bacterium]
MMVARARDVLRLALATALVAACGSDNPKTGVDAAVDAPPDAASLGVFALPLGTPSGNDQGALYTATLTASGSSFLLDVDTGSTVTGLAGSSCTQCSGMSPLYLPGTGATDTGQQDSASYADGSGWMGEIFSDMVGLAHGSPDVKLSFVEITSQSTNPAFFFGNEYQGIFGLGPDALLDPGTTAYLDGEITAGVTGIMAFELCPMDGTMWLGGYDPTHVAGTMQYTPILSGGVNQAFYSVNMTAMALGGNDLGATSVTLDNPIVDTGTSLFYIPSATEAALVAALNNNSGFKALFPGQTLTDPTTSMSMTAGCATAASGTTQAMIDQMLPKLSMTFAGVAGGSPITVDALPMSSYFYDAGGGMFCLAVYGGGDQGNATMGDTIMRAFVTVIDKAHHQIGFAPSAHCPAPFVKPAGHRLRERGRGPHHVRH